MYKTFAITHPLGTVIVLPMIHFELACYAEVHVNREKLNLNKGNYTKLNNQIKDISCAVFDAPDIQQQYDAFTSTLSEWTSVSLELIQRVDAATSTLTEKP